MVRRSTELSLSLKYDNRDQKVNGDYLHVDLPATVIKDSVSDAMIVQKEEASDSNPWENADHNDRLCLETTAVAPSLFRAKKKTLKKRSKCCRRLKIKSNFLFLSTLLKPFGVFKRGNEIPSATTRQKEKEKEREEGKNSLSNQTAKITSLQTA